MLTVFRERHMKKILWFLAVIIIVAFGFSGVSSLLDRKKFIGIMAGKKISTSDFAYYEKMAKLFLLLHADESKSVGQREADALALDFLVLLWKVKQEKITVSDKEVVEYIKNNLFSQNSFSKESYDNFIKRISQRYNLGLSLRNFEEYMRDFIKKDKLLKKLINIEIGEEEVKDLYKKDTQEAKIAYIFIPYEKFIKNLDKEITSRQVREFYEKNSSLFRRVPKPGIDEKEEKKAYVPRLEEIEAEVKERLIRQKSKEKAKEFSQKIIEKINKKKKKSLKKIAKREKLEFKESEQFKFYGNIDGLALNIEARKAIFSLTKNQIHPNALLLTNGACIIQLKDITEVDEKNFEEKKEGYLNSLKRNKEFIERLKFFNQIRKEANLEVFSKE